MVANYSPCIPCSGRSRISPVAFRLLVGYFIAATMAINGQITVGTYMAYAGLVGWLIWPMRNLGRLIVQTSTGLVSYGRVMEIIKQKREPLTEGECSPNKPFKESLCLIKLDLLMKIIHLFLTDISFYL